MKKCKKNNKMAWGFSFPLIVCLIFSYSNIGITANASPNLKPLEQNNTVKETNRDYIEGEAVVLLKNENISKKNLDKSLGKEISVKETGVLKNPDNDASGEDNDKYAVVSSDCYNTKNLLKQLEKSDNISIAEPNYIYHTDSISNDEYSDYQWYLEDGKTSSSYDVNYTSTLSSPKSGTPVVVVADTGVDASHSDLKDVMYSANMYNSKTNSMVPAYDDDGHGTHCAGIIAAATNNNTGIAGISPAKIIAAKCMDANGQGSSVDLLRIYNYALSMAASGVNIKAVNLSLGGGVYSEALLTAINKAGEAGILTICSSGNENVNIDSTKSYPACYESEYIITVGSYNPYNTISCFSNYGQKNVDVFAPGEDILSTFPTLSSSNKEGILSDYTQELNHELFFEDFQDYDTSKIKTNHSDSSVTIADNIGYATKQPTDSSYKSLCWNINAAANEKYYIAIPYTLSKKTNKNTYLGARIQTTLTSGSSARAKLAMFDSSTNDFNDNDAKVDGIQTSIENTNMWEEFSFQVTDPSGKNSHQLSKSAGTYYTILRLTTAQAGNYKIYIDNLGLSTSRSNYVFASGTSMAAPVITGEVALLSSLNPSMSISEIRARVLGGVDVSDSFAGKCTSGGRVNFEKALSSNPNSSITNVTVSGASLTINGYFFGNAGNVVITDASGNSSTLSLKSWSDQKIVANLAGLKEGYYTLQLIRKDGVSCYYGETFYYKTPALIDKIKLNKTNVTLNPGKTLQLYATITPFNAANPKVTWTSSNQKYATVSNTGKVKALKAGNKHTVTITCKSTDGSGKKAICKIKIAQPVTKIKLNKTKASLKAGGHLKLKATVTPKNAANRKVKWSSSNKKYATVSKSGKVTAKKKGKGHTVTITCKATDGSKKKKSCKIKIR